MAKRIHNPSKSARHNHTDGIGSIAIVSDRRREFDPANPGGTLWNSIPVSGFRLSPL